MSERRLDTGRTLRYSRQMILKEIGYGGQEKLLNSSVLVVGAGGLDYPVLYYLAPCPLSFKRLLLFYEETVKELVQYELKCL